MKTRGLQLASLIVGLLMLVGCGGGGDEKKDKGKEKGTEPKASQPHGEWWCDEHGIPEEECGLCHEKIRNRLKAEEKCPKHPDRKTDQCFICNPDKWPASAARYKARYPGKEPPQPNEENWSMNKSPR